MDAAKNIFDGYAIRRKPAPKTALDNLREAGDAMLSVDDIAALALEARREETTRVLREAALALQKCNAEVDLVAARSQSRSALAKAKTITNPSPEDSFESVQRKALESRRQAASAGCLTPLFEKEVAVSENKALRSIALREYRRFLMYCGNADWTKKDIDTKFSQVVSQLKQAGVDLPPQKWRGLENARADLYEGSAAKRIEKLSKVRSIDYDLDAIQREDDIIRELIPTENETLLASWATAKTRLVKREEDRHISRKTKEKTRTAAELWQYQR